MNSPALWNNLSLNQRLARLRKLWPDREEVALMGMAGLPNEPILCSGYEEFRVILREAPLHTSA